MVNSVNETERKLALNMLNELVDAANIIIAEAIQSRDDELLKLAIIYTAPVMNLMEKSSNGEVVTIKDCLEAATIGSLDAEASTAKGNFNSDAMVGILTNGYQVIDDFDMMKQKMDEQSNEMKQSINKYIELLASLQNNCQGPKRKLMGRLVCQSPEQA